MRACMWAYMCTHVLHWRTYRLHAWYAPSCDSPYQPHVRTLSIQCPDSLFAAHLAHHSTGNIGHQERDTELKEKVGRVSDCYIQLCAVKLA